VLTMYVNCWQFVHGSVNCRYTAQIVTVTVFAFFFWFVRAVTSALRTFQQSVFLAGYNFKLKIVSGATDDLHSQSSTCSSNFAVLSYTMEKRKTRQKVYLLFSLLRNFVSCEKHIAEVKHFFRRRPMYQCHSVKNSTTVRLQRVQ